MTTATVPCSVPKISLAAGGHLPALRAGHITLEELP